MNRRPRLQAPLVVAACLWGAILGPEARGGQEIVEGTTRLYNQPLPQLIAAITSAFSFGTYHRMVFIDAPFHFDAASGRRTSIPATNEWQLSTALEPLGVLSQGGRSLPYFAQFDIIAREAGSNRSTATVWTTSSYVLDGREPGAHGGWARHSTHVLPLREEETNLLSAIESQLLPRASRATSPPTLGAPGGGEEPAEKWRRFAEANPQAKDDLLRAINQETNAGLRGELLKVLAIMTNHSNK